jgi:hypothetical protein
VKRQEGDGSSVTDGHRRAGETLKDETPGAALEGNLGKAAEEQTVEVVETARTERSGRGKPAPVVELRFECGVDSAGWNAEGAPNLKRGA